MLVHNITVHSFFLAFPPCGVEYSQAHFSFDPQVYFRTINDYSRFIASTELHLFINEV